MTYALRRDDNEPEIIAALQRIGCSVWQQVKRDQKATLTDDQVYWHSIWRGKVRRVETVEQALKAVEAI